MTGEGRGGARPLALPWELNGVWSPEAGPSQPGPLHGDSFQA